MKVCMYMFVRIYEMYDDAQAVSLLNGEVFGYIPGREEN